MQQIAEIRDSSPGCADKRSNHNLSIHLIYNLRVVVRVKVRVRHRVRVF